MNEHETMTDDEVTAMMADMGFERLADDRYPFWQRWKCRVLGPHEWVPVQRLIPSTGAILGGTLTHVVSRSGPLM